MCIPATIIVDGELTNTTEFAFRYDGRIITAITRTTNQLTGERIGVITTAPPISHLPHAQRNF